MGGDAAVRVKTLPGRPYGAASPGHYSRTNYGKHTEMRTVLQKKKKKTCMRVE